MESTEQKRSAGRYQLMQERHNAHSTWKMVTNSFSVVPDVNRYIYYSNGWNIGPNFDRKNARSKNHDDYDDHLNDPTGFSWKIWNDDAYMDDPTLKIEYEVDNIGRFCYCVISKENVDALAVSSNCREYLQKRRNTIFTLQVKIHST